MKSLVAGLLLGVFAVTNVGCATFKHDLPIVLSYVQDSITILNTISGISEMFFIAHPNDALKAKVDKAITDAELALDAGNRATQGLTDLTNDQITAAFAPFITAYGDLEQLLKNAGIISGSAAVASVANTQHGYVIPTPLLVIKAH